MKAETKRLIGFFGKLSKERLENLKFHHENKTPIFCGRGADVNFISSGGHG